MFKHITSVVPQQGYELLLSFDDGVQGVVSFDQYVGKGIFHSRNDTLLFKNVLIGNQGRSLVWSESIDMCADSLREKVSGKNIIGS